MVRKTLRRNYISIFVIALIVGIYLAVPGKEAIAWAEDSSIYNISGHMYESNDVYWFKGGDVATINAGDGYKISISQDETYDTSISLSEADIDNNKAIIYYKHEQDSAILGNIDLNNSIKWDSTAPTGQITISDTYNSTHLSSNISFNTFLNEPTFHIENAEDVGSGVEDIYYYISEINMSNATDNDNSQLIDNLDRLSPSVWSSYTTGDNISLPTGQNVVYVKIVDNVGNVSYISSDGIVSYNTSSWGQDHTRDDGVVQYTDANGKSSISISSSNAKLNNNILWLYEESKGRGTWYGLELADVENIVDKDYRLYIQWLSPSDSGYHELYSKLDDDVRSKIQNNKNMIFCIGIEDSTGVRYVPVGIVNVYVMMEQDWNISDMRGCFINSLVKEFVSVRVKEDIVYPEGKARFAVMQMRHFSPYILYDMYTDAEKSANEGEVGGSTVQPSGDSSDGVDGDNTTEGTDDGDAGSEKGTGIDTSTDGVSDDELGSKIDNSNADNNKGNNIERINNPDTSDDLGLHRWYAIMILSGLACWVMGKFYQRVENVGKFSREK